MLKDEEGKGGQHVAELPAANVVSTYEPSTLPDGLHSAAVVHIPQLDMPFPLAGRAFLSLVVTATADNEFWNVSVPVQDEAFPVSHRRPHRVLGCRQRIAEPSHLRTPSRAAGQGRRERPGPRQASRCRARAQAPQRQD
jgi:hypothetical protein